MPSGSDASAAGAEAIRPYRVLARKYRPSTFDDLIGQSAMVRTLSNAFDLGRIHQAYVLTGVRGVGKTTTARILARAFNYEIAGKVERPTIVMPEIGVHCQAIIESRHMDVIEMDAASHTGIDDVREIIEGARYRPVAARFKVYIIDEVHMLSKQAFNGLLKTLEEPPEHVKFLFATTEIDRVPVTVRSRCQRFDLRRIEADVMVRHLAGICARETVSVTDAGLGLIARAAEGSVRDALSLLDQAIAHGSGADGGGVDEASIQAMLGLADKARVIDLFEALMTGRIAEALALLKGQDDLGADPGQVLTELAEFVHFVTRLKIAPETLKDASVTQDERVRGAGFADVLPIRVLTRAWQILLKGLQDVKDSPRPLASADMVLVRIAYAADLPTPDEALRAMARIQGGMAQGGAAPAVAQRPILSGPSPQLRVESQSRPAPSLAVEPPVRLAPALRPEAKAELRARPRTLEDVVALAQTHRDVRLKLALEQDVRLVRFEEGRIEFATMPRTSPQLATLLSSRLQDWTGMRWMVVVSSAEGAPTIKERADALAQDQLRGVRADPNVRSVLDGFPGAEIVAVRGRIAPEGPSAPSADPPDEDVGYADDLITEDDL